MTLFPNQFKRYLARFDELIEEGEKIHQSIQIIPGEYYYPKPYLAYFGDSPLKAPDDYIIENTEILKQWIIKYKSLLDQAIPSSNIQRKLIEEPGYSFDPKSNIENHLSALKAIKDDFEKGFLTNYQSGLDCFTIEDVVKLLKRLPAGLRRWTWEKKARTKNGEARQWYIDNEYHVQNLIYFQLAPLFPDIREEEFTRSVAHKKPKVDLEIPSLKLVIEIKFWYSQITPQSIIGGIAEDASLYLTDSSPNENIIVFIWDELRRTEEHDLLVKGLKTMKGIFDVVIVCRPSFIPDSTAIIDEDNVM